MNRWLHPYDARSGTRDGTLGFCESTHVPLHQKGAIRKSCRKAEKESGAGIPLKSGWISR